MTGYIIYKLPGHRGSVNDVCFHPDEPIRELLQYMIGLLLLLTYVAIAVLSACWAQHSTCCVSRAGSSVC